MRIAGYEPFYYTGTSEKEVQRELDKFRLKTLRKEIIPEKQTVNSYIEYSKPDTRHCRRPKSARYIKQ